MLERLARFLLVGALAQTIAHADFVCAPSLSSRFSIQDIRNDWVRRFGEIPGPRDPQGTGADMLADLCRSNPQFFYLKIQETSILLNAEKMNELPDGVYVFAMIEVPPEVTNGEPSRQFRVGANPTSLQHFVKNVSGHADVAHGFPAWIGGQLRIERPFRDTNIFDIELDNRSGLIRSPEASLIHAVDWFADQGIPVRTLILRSENGTVLFPPGN